MATMDQFDFNAPINATIIFDDSEDEVFEGEENTRNKHILTKESVKTEIISNFKTKGSDSTSKAICNIIKTSTQYNTEKINCDQALDGIDNEHISEKIKKDVIPEKPLDMPSLDEKLHIKSYNCSFDEKNSNIATDNSSKISTESNNMSKKRPCVKSGNYGKKLKSVTSPNKNNNCKEKLVQEVNNFDGSGRILQENDLERGKEIQEKSNTLKYFPSSDETLSTKKISFDASQTHIAMEKTKDIERDQKLQTINKKQWNENNVTRSLNEFNETLASSFKGLLETVSQHLIYILNYYKSFLHIYHTSKDSIFIQKAKTDFIAKRNHFFDLSYTSVVNIIIPRSNDPTFVKNFIDDTVHICHLQACTHSVSQIESLFDTMLSWTKSKHKHINELNSNNHFITTYPIRLQSHQESQHNNITDHNRQMKYQMSQSNNTCQQSGLSTKYINQWQILSSPSQHSQPYPIMKNILNSNLKNPPSFNVTIQHPYHNQTTPPNEYIDQAQPKPPEQSKFQPMYKQYGRNHYNENQIPFTKQNILPMSTYNQNKTNMQPYTSYNNVIQQNYMPSRQKSVQKIAPLPSNLNMTNKQPCTSYSSTDQKNSPIQHHSLSLWQSSKQQTEQNPTQKWPGHTSWQNNAVYSTQSYQHDSVTSSKNYTSAVPPENTRQGESLRSSISRDSGFISPLNFNTNGEYLPQEDQQAPQSSTLPFITHVTSLNPSASLIKEGNCVICQSTTNKKCQGCFNYYYCSNACQVQDWNEHRLICQF